ncbi:carbohydrate ABC transporter permease [Rhodophyticola sp. CCM32]|uniref:carbohydrate ABC transporter permease n=1 Tax=Rhodophyticola sp. CCM32 TaxID=2916397 RepID=UPI00107F2125|nr:carbohydrate ABC transporter permease [Rhodophyticola sp. CCM32]QBY01362.1 carbohydrate ABC transporter permease [Rhodophyticola sp. CCM32]
MTAESTTTPPVANTGRHNRLRRKLTPQKLFWNGFHYLFLTLASFIVVAPLYIAFISSFKTPIEMLRGEKTDWPENFGSLTNYWEFFDRAMVGTAFYNTVFVVTVSLVIVTLIGTMVAYVVDRFRFPGRRLILLAYVVVMAVPHITTQVSLYQVILTLGLVNSKWALIVLYSGADIVSLYIFIVFLGSISREVDESARIEGANYFQIYWKIILPLMTPAISTVVILRTIHIYNDFILPYLYTPRVEDSTVSMLLYRANDMMSSTTEAILMAGIMIVIAPTLIAFLLLQRQIVSGMMRGAVKG